MLVERKDCYFSGLFNTHLYGDVPFTEEVPWDLTSYQPWGNVSAIHTEVLAQVLSEMTDTAHCSG